MSGRYQRDQMEYQPFLGDEGEQEVDLDIYSITSTRKKQLLSRRRVQILVISVSGLFLFLLILGVILAARIDTKLPTPSQIDGVLGDNKVPDLKPSDHYYWFKSAAVAADSTECSTVGRELLEKGGNAVDASIGALLCSGLTDPQSMGIGGGFFMTIYNSKSGEATVIDAREEAPAKASQDMYGGNASLASHGPLSIAVPGEVKGYWLAHQRYGRLPWSDLFQKVITLAKDGFRVPVALHNAIQDAKDLLMTEPSLREVFFNKKTGKLFHYNETMIRPKLAETLQYIADEGINALINGTLIDLMVEDLKDIGSLITKEDIANYKVKEKKPVEITLRNSVRVVSPPPPASGAVLEFMLNILDGYKLSPKQLVNRQWKILKYHRTAEAFKFAYAKRTALGDEDFVDVAELVKNLTSRSYADSIRAMITDNATHDYEYYGPTFYGGRQKTGTSHLSVIDPDGNSVSVTSTINGRFGAYLRGTRTGIIWNNEMDDFSAPNITNEYGLRPSEYNFIRPGKRPLSSMCPTIFLKSVRGKDGEVTGERVKMVLGASGGSLITTAVAWIAEHNLWLGHDMKQAVDLNRLHHQLLPQYLQYETGFDKAVLEGLRGKGHVLKSFHHGKNVAQGIEVMDDGRILAASDYRKGGTPDGF